jgi:hypothetical protein
MKNIKYPDNYKNWPTTWKSCFEDGVVSGRASAHNSDYAKFKKALECIADYGGCLTGEDAHEMKQIAIEALQ